MGHCRKHCKERVRMNKRLIVSLFFLVIGLCGLFSSAFLGCGAAGPTQPGPCPPSVTYCPVDSGENDIQQVQRYAISRNSNFVAQLADPVEVDGLIHMADYREPTKAKIWLERGTWLYPERLGSIADAEKKASRSGTPMTLEMK